MVGKKVTAMLLCSVLCLFNMTSVFAMENEGSVEIYEKYRNDRGIIRMCEQVAASGNTLILYSA